MTEMVETLAHHIWAMADHDEREARAVASKQPMRPCREWSPEQRRRHLRQAAYVLQFLQGKTETDLAEGYECAWEIATDANGDAALSPTGEGR